MEKGETEPFAPRNGKTVVIRPPIQIDDLTPAKQNCLIYSLGWIKQQKLHHDFCILKYKRWPATKSNILAFQETKRLRSKVDDYGFHLQCLAGKANNAQCWLYYLLVFYAIVWNCKTPVCFKVKFNLTAAPSIIIIFLITK